MTNVLSDKLLPFTAFCYITKLPVMSHSDSSLLEKCICRPINAQTHTHTHTNTLAHSYSHACSYTYAVVAVHESQTTKHRWDLERDIVVGYQEWYRREAKSTVQSSCHCSGCLLIHLQTDGLLKLTAARQLLVLLEAHSLIMQVTL